MRSGCVNIGLIWNICIFNEARRVRSLPSLASGLKGTFTDQRRLMNGRRIQNWKWLKLLLRTTAQLLQRFFFRFQKIQGLDSTTDTGCNKPFGERHFTFRKCQLILWILKKEFFRDSWPEVVFYDTFSKNRGFLEKECKFLATSVHTKDTVHYYGGKDWTYKNKTCFHVLNLITLSEWSYSMLLIDNLSPDIEVSLVWASLFVEFLEMQPQWKIRQVWAEWHEQTQR